MEAAAPQDVSVSRKRPLEEEEEEGAAGRKEEEEAVEQPETQKKARVDPSSSSSDATSTSKSGNYVEAPHLVDAHDTRPSLFLGGGITGCPDWQAVVREQLNKRCPDLVLVNPRRAKWDATIQSLEQIEWEHHHLRKAKAIMFWFPCETLCPITLYELGAWTILSLQTGTKLFVGCHEKYARKEDVIIQTRLANSAVAVREDLQAVIDDIIAWYESSENPAHKTA